MEKRISRWFCNVIVREKSGMKPILLKLGLAAALTFVGFLYTHYRAKRINPKGNLSGHGSQVNLGGIRALSSCSNLTEENIFDTEETCINKVVDRSSPIGLSPRTKQTGEKDELNDLMKKEVETPRSKVGSPVAHTIHEKDECEQEIGKLRNVIRMLQERERNLEVQLLEYCGLREQEAVVMELQNRLKISSMEAKMFNLKVDNLQSENWRLEAQVAGHGKVLAELEATKTKVKFLKRKLKYEAEQYREEIIVLKQKVSKFQDNECKAAACSEDNQMKLKRLKDLETEAEQLRNSNLRLQMENSDLARRLDSTQILANAVLEHPEADALKEEDKRLRRENERLMKEIEQLKTDRCSDLEELVYLRWINACLRHELKNYQPPHGKTVARDLSRSLSPTSVKKAKQLIVEYANNAEGRGSISDLDSDQWSSSQASFLTDSGECEEYSPLDNPSDARANTTTNNKTKVFGKLMKLLRGKDSQNIRGRVSSLEKSLSRENSNSPRFRSSMSTGNDAGAEGISKSENVTPTYTSRNSFDLNRTMSLKEDSRRNSDVGSSKNFSPRKRGRGDLKIRTDSFSESSTVDKYNLIKYAEALKDSNGTPKPKVHRRTASYSSF